MDVANLDQSRLFGDEEDITFKEEEVALNGFEIGLETWMSISARRGLGLHLSSITKIETDLWKLPEPMIFLPANARKTLDTTSYVGSS